MLATDSQPFNFNYVAFDQMAGLYVACNIYDETNPSSPITVATKQPLQDRGQGLYTGAFQGEAAHNYSVEILVYEDSGFTTVDPSRSPGGETFQVVAQQGVQTNTVFVTTPVRVNVRQLRVRARIRQLRVRARVKC